MSISMSGMPRLLRCVFVDTDATWNYCNTLTLTETDKLSYHHSCKYIEHSTLYNVHYISLSIGWSKSLVRQYFPTPWESVKRSSGQLNVLSWWVSITDGFYFRFKTQKTSQDTSHHYVSARERPAQEKSIFRAGSFHIVRTSLHQHTVPSLPWVHQDQV